MKATIRYTVYDGYLEETEGLVRVDEITHCVPFKRGDFSLIYLTNGKIIKTVTPIDELERRIDAAEGPDRKLL